MKWMGPSPQDERLTLSEPVRHQGRKKKTARWCKGKVGVAHVPVTILGQSWGNTCHESGWYDLRTRQWHTDGAWSCYHVVACAVCGKHLGLVADCPNNTTAVPDRRRR